MHNKNDYFEMLPPNHYDVLLEVSGISKENLKRNKLFAVPDLHTTLKTLLSSFQQWKKLERFSKKINLAVEYNDSAPPKKEKLPSFRSAYQI